MYVDITAYVDRDGDLLTLDSTECLRRATPSERRKSLAEEPTGAIKARVSVRTLRRRVPMLRRQRIAMQGWDW